MTPIISQIQMGHTGVATLVKADGTIVRSRNAAPDMNWEAGGSESCAQRPIAQAAAPA